MASFKPGGAYSAEFVTSNPTTLAAQTADSLPTATANRNGTDDAAFVLTVTNLDTGRYKVTGTVPVTYVAGDSVALTAAATVAGVAGKGVVDAFVVDSATSSDAATLAAIKAKTDLLGASAVTVSAPLDSNGDLTLRRGRDYKTADGLAPVWSATGKPDLTGAVLTFRAYRGATTYLTKTGTVLSPTGAQSWTVDLAATDLALVIAAACSYEVYATLVDTDSVPLAEGALMLNS